jgi:hypothetical protein
MSANLSLALSEQPKKRKGCGLGLGRTSIFILQDISPRKLYIRESMGILSRTIRVEVFRAYVDF